MEILVLIIALAIAGTSVYWYIKLMTKEDKKTKDVWIALLCFWGALLSIVVIYVIVANRIGPVQ
ncbi:MAG: hypothetical protein J5525_01830 [Lachnospiraceae bacterium]|nr:hypothetical protein [Lachnospiraceae bacterium]